MLSKPLSHLAPRLLALPRSAKRVVVMLLDIALCVLTVWLAVYLRLGEFTNFSSNSFFGKGAIAAAFASVVIAIPLFIATGLYRAIFRYNDWPALITVGQTILKYSVFFFILFTVIGVSGVPRTVGIIQPLLLLLFVGSSRTLARVWLGDRYHSILRFASRPKVLIYGAGKTGRQLAMAISHSHDMQMIGFIDDDDRLHGHVLNGLPIYNPLDLTGAKAGSQ